MSPHTRASWARSWWTLSSATTTFLLFIFINGLFAPGVSAAPTVHHLDARQLQSSRNASTPVPPGLVDLWDRVSVLESQLQSATPGSTFFTNTERLLNSTRTQLILRLDGFAFVTGTSSSSSQRPTQTAPSTSGGPAPTITQGPGSTAPSTTSSRTTSTRRASTITLGAPVRTTATPTTTSIPTPVITATRLGTSVLVVTSQGLTSTSTVVITTLVTATQQAGRPQSTLTRISVGAGGNADRGGGAGQGGQGGVGGDGDVGRDRQVPGGSGPISQPTVVANPNGASTSRPTTIAGAAGTQGGSITTSNTSFAEAAHRPTWFMITVLILGGACILG